MVVRKPRYLERRLSPSGGLGKRGGATHLAGKIRAFFLARPRCACDGEAGNAAECSPGWNWARFCAHGGYFLMYVCGGHAVVTVGELQSDDDIEGGRCGLHPEACSP